MPRLLLNTSSFIETAHCRFLIMDAPTDRNLPKYIEEMAKKNVVALVRACKPTYDTQKLVDAGIRVEELFFEDGSPPEGEVLDRWLDLVNEVFSQPNEGCIAVHCVAGLGRAPVLVAVALIERDHMDNTEAAELVRGKRKGAFNARQLKYLETYEPRRKGGCCVIL